MNGTNGDDLEDIDEEEYFAADGGGMDIGRGSQYDPPGSGRPQFERSQFHRRGPKGNPFEYRRPRDQNHSDQKLDAILAQMKGLATKQDIGSLQRKVNHVQEDHARLVKKVEKLAEQVPGASHKRIHLQYMP